MRRLIFTAALLLVFTQTGHASLECDGYFDAGYFGTTYYLDGYWSESLCGSDIGGTRLSIGLEGIGF